ncbi:hypothetical protein [Kibdelosporangium phytohabitans]|nr:hypothetical protein [Kibdelosporangium phytohabitans]MBE1467011.1 hypothetical protein [Kibdelosporangium phytohabitans]
MTRGEEGPERNQRTVAELLAKYGGSSEEAAPPRRRRRRADDAEETAPQAIIDRVMSDSGSLPRIPAEEPPPPAERRQPPPATGRRRSGPGHQSSAQLPKLPPPPPQAVQPTQRQMPPVPQPPAPGAEQRRPPAEQRRPPQNSQSMPRPKPQPQPPGQQSAQWPTPPPMAPPPTAEPGGLAARLDGRQDSRADMRLPVEQPPMPMEGVTEQMPRIPDELPPGASGGPGTRTGQHPAPHRVARTQRSMPMPQPGTPAFPQHEPDESDNYPTEFHGFKPVGGEATQFVEGIERDEDDDEYDSRPSMPSIEHERPIAADDDFDDLDEEDEDEDEDGSPVKEWLSMAGQLAIGVVGGAALWLGFNWLWGKLPAAALVVALVVIVGLVWVVRKIRRADDLQTTILTVLVGLVVTVSPAAMLLLAK